MAAIGGVFLAAAAATALVPTPAKAGGVLNAVAGVGHAAVDSTLGVPVSCVQGVGDEAGKARSRGFAVPVTMAASCGVNVLVHAGELVVNLVTLDFLFGDDDGPAFTREEALVQFPD